jgi:hypothetical protein
MIQRDVSDRDSGYIMARIEPSARPSLGNYGIFMEINDHYQFDKEGTGELIAKLLVERFEASLRTSEGIINQIMSLSHA